MQDVLLLVVFWCGVVYLVMHLLARRTRKQLEEAAKNAQRFRDLTELSADWFWETDAEHRITWISGGAPVATFFGGTPTYGKRFWEIPRVEVDPRALQSLLEGLGERLPFFDLEISRADERGARQIHIISGQCRRAADGTFLGYRGVGRDVTEQRRAERALAAAKERLELALGGGNLAEWDYDVESDSAYLGIGWAGFVGREPTAGVTRGAELAELVHPDDREAAKKAFVAALKGEAPTYVADHRVRTENGGWRWLRSTGQVTERDASGRATRVSGTVADIDDRKRAEEALREAEQRYRGLVELAPDGIVVSSKRLIEYANPAGARILRAPSARRLVGMKSDDLMLPPSLARYEERMRYLQAGPGVTSFEERGLRCLDGTEITVEAASVSFLERGRLIVLTMFRDVTESRKAREALAERERRFRDVAEASGEYVWEADAAWRYSYLSERVEEVLGYPRAELLGRRPHEFMPLGQDRGFDAWLAKNAPDGKAFRELVHRSITKSGRVIWQSVSAVPVRDAEGRFVGYRGTAADVTPRKQAEARVEYLATRDPLTGLPNRVLLNDRGGQAILSAARSRSQIALLAIDIDRFKLVNESLGHRAGDQLLRAIAERLETLRADTLARLGGDDFVVLQSVRNVEDAAGLAERILGVLARPFTLDGRTLNVGASIGISVYPNDGRDLAELLKNADAAMYHAKESGRGTWRMYEPALQARSVERLRLENELRSALARSELMLHWQPVVRGRRRVVGAEALVRWQHPERGLLMPEEFVPLAEECGLIRAVGEWTLERALAQAGAWQRAHPGRAWYAVNVSAQELAQGDAYIERVASALKTHDVPGACLEIEVTERSLMSDLEENVETLRRIGELGVRFAIDDFGTGYSSLAYLRQLPIQKLKIDRSFLRSIDSQAADEAIVRAIAALGKALGISVAAEGIESEAQLSRLLSLGCEEWQGHYFSAPLDAAGFEQLLAKDFSSERLA
ncbi:MAG: EAL domain-containing protein [Betaproteobacteria bacterium]|nr:MAG: EAL domain-containing protein [Betaproteobacteria bacterium]